MLSIIVLRFRNTTFHSTRQMQSVYEFQFNASMLERFTMNIHFDELHYHCISSTFDLSNLCYNMLLSLIYIVELF